VTEKMLWTQENSLLRNDCHRCLRYTETGYNVDKSGKRRAYHEYHVCIGCVGNYQAQLNPGLNVVNNTI